MVIFIVGLLLPHFAQAIQSNQLQTENDEIRLMPVSDTNYSGISLNPKAGRSDHVCHLSGHLQQPQSPPLPARVL